MNVTNSARPLHKFHISQLDWSKENPSFFLPTNEERHWVKKKRKKKRKRKKERKKERKEERKKRKICEWKEICEGENLNRIAVTKVPHISKMPFLNYFF